MQKSISKFAKEKIVKGIIYSLFDYGSIINYDYGLNGTLSNEKRLQVKQNDCIRYILDFGIEDHVTDHKNNLKMLTLYKREYLILVFIYKYLHIRKPQYLDNIFK